MAVATDPNYRCMFTHVPAIKVDTPVPYTEISVEVLEDSGSGRHVVDGRRYRYSHFAGSDKTWNIAKTLLCIPLIGAFALPYGISQLNQKRNELYNEIRNHEVNPERLAVLVKDIREYEICRLVQSCFVFVMLGTTFLIVLSLFPISTVACSIIFSVALCIMLLPSVWYFDDNISQVRIRSSLLETYEKWTEFAQGIIEASGEVNERCLEAYIILQVKVDRDRSKDSEVQLPVWPGMYRAG